MPTRQAHRKTKSGCSSCKKRHIKCDERGPPCANCRIRNVKCNYAASKLSRESLILPNESTALVAVVGSRPLELELFHHWSMETYKSLTFENFDGDDVMWQRKVPMDALKHEFLLHSIFAITALHIASCKYLPEAQRYQLAALEYHNLAITAFRVKQQNLDESNHQSLFAFSVINLALSVALPYYAPRDVTSGIISNLATVFQLLHGAHSIVSISRTWLSNGPFKSLMDTTPQESMTNFEGAPAAALMRLRAIRDEAYRSDIETQELPLDAVRLYESRTRAIDTLEICFNRFHAYGTLVCFYWLCRIDSMFIEEITKTEPVAMLITMHWAILLDKLGEKKWWARSSGKYLVAELSRDLLSQKPQWRTEVSWVHQQVGLPSLKDTSPCP